MGEPSDSGQVMVRRLLLQRGNGERGQGRICPH